MEPVSAAVVEYIADNLLAAARVQARGGLVEYEHLGAHGYDAGYGYAALLAAGELQRALVKELLAHANEARGLAHALVYLAVRKFHVPRAEGYVLVHRLLEELVLRVLEDEADLEADVARGLLGGEDILPLAVHLPRGRREQAVEVLHEGALARARMPNHGHQLAGVEFHVYILYGRLLERRAHAVGVREVFGFYNSVHWRIPFPYLSAAIMAPAHSSTVSAVRGQLPAAGVEAVYELRRGGDAEPLAL